MFLVTGVTGNIGSEVAKALVAGGHSVSGVVRNAGDSLPAGVTPVVGDLNEPGPLLDAFDGVEGLFLLPGYNGAEQLLDAARRAGVSRLVQLSGGSAGSRDLSNAITAYMAGAEDLATASGLEWTILRPSAFMTNTLRWLPQIAAGDEIRIPFANLRTAVIDPADIGAVAATALTADGHAGQVYRLSGPESLLPAEQIAILAEVLGRPLRAVAQPNDEARAEMLGAMPVEYVDAFFDFYVNGSLDESPVFPTVEQIIGRRPGTFASWAEAHADAFR